MLIYKITNLINGKSYIGQTRGTEKHRWMKHVIAARNGSQCCIHKAIRKYGADSFSVKIIVRVPKNSMLDFMERFCIYLFGTLVPSGYNLTEGGEGRTPSLSSRRKMSRSHIGKTLSEETKRNMSKASLGKKKTKEHRLNISKGRKGIQFSKKTLAKMSKAAMGNTNRRDSLLRRR